MNTAEVFETPLQQTYQMEQRLKKELSKDVAEEIIAYVRIKSQEKYDQIFDKLIQRVNRIDKIYATETESKSEYFERMQQFLTATNPRDIAEELKRVLVFHEIESEYKNLIQFFSKREFGKLYLRYQFDKQAFKALSMGVLSDINIINFSLDDYADAFA